MVETTQLTEGKSTGGCRGTNRKLQGTSCDIWKLHKPAQKPKGKYFGPSQLPHVNDDAPLKMESLPNALISPLPSYE